jgi:hypothetical protein
MMVLHHYKVECWETDLTGPVTRYKNVKMSAVQSAATQKIGNSGVTNLENPN